MRTTQLLNKAPEYPSVVRIVRATPVFWTYCLLAFLSAGVPTYGQVNVTQHHNDLARDGLYIDSSFTEAQAAGLTRNLSFNGSISGDVYAQPLYIEGGPGGLAVVIAVSESDDVFALNATNGSIVWQTNVASPIANHPYCGNLSPYGITGTPVVDLPSRAIFFDALTEDPSTGTIEHLIYSLDVDTGALNSGWPINVNNTALFGTTMFNSTYQGQRGALAIVGGTLYVPYGGLYGDCGTYHGWVIGVPLSSPSTVMAWATTANSGGIWAVGGIASDGTDLFVATGNTAGATSWGGGEAILNLQPNLVLASGTANYWAPTDWSTLDDEDLDLGGSGPLILNVPGATPSSLVVALGKDGNAYLLNRSNLGGIGAPVNLTQVANSPIIQAAATYQTSKGSYVVFANSGYLYSLLIAPSSPPTISLAWSASENGSGSPFVTSTDGTHNVVVWGIGSESDQRLHGFDGDTGATVFSGGGVNELMSGTRRYNTGIVARGRIYVANDNMVYEFNVPQATTNPVITWTTPASITYGTALSSTQLDASANVSGTFAYTPPSGTVLNKGTNTLSVVFTPTDTVDYTSVTDTVSLVVSPASLTVTANNGAKTYGQTLNFAGTEFSTSGLVNGNAVSSVTLASSGTAPTASVASSPYTITPSAAVGSGLTNYTITYATGKLTVAPAALTIAASPESKTYGQTVSFGSGSTLFSRSGLQNGETIGSVTLAVNNNGGAATAPVSGSPYAITPSAATGGTFTPGNYSITYSTGNLTVSAAALTITPSPESKTYGQTVSFGSGSALFGSSGLQNGETIGTVTLAVNNNGGAASAPVSGSPYIITPSAATGGTFTPGNYSITYLTGNLTVSGAALTVTAGAQSKTYGQTVSFGSGSTLFTSTSLQNGETIGTVTLAVNNSGGTATAPVSGSPYTITPSAATGGTFTPGNYAITYATGHLTVNAAALTVTASAESKTYGQTVSFGSGSTLFGSTGLQNGETIETVTLAVNNSGGAATAPVSGSPYTITPSAATGGTFTPGNYAITYATGHLTVNGAALAITASPESKTYGQTVSFGAGSTLFSSSGLLNGETIGTVTLVVNNNGGAATAPVGGSPYTITPSAATGGTFTPGNYAITYATGHLTVNGAALAITANPESKTYGQTVSFGAGSTLFSSSGLQNGETIGTVTLVVNNNGGAATAPVSGSPYTITPSAATGGTFTPGNYSITYLTGNLNVGGAALTVTASAQSKTYGQTVSFGVGSTLFSSSGLQNGETIGTVTLAVNNSGGEATAPVGESPYTIMPSAATGGTFTPGNYVITYAAGHLTVNATALTIAASPEAKTYGQTVSFGSGSTLFGSTGLQNGETIGTVTLAVNNNGGAATAPVSGSPYTITPSAATGGTFSAGNYSITYATGNLTVNGAALTIAASAQSKTYGQTVSFGSGSTLFGSTGLQNGETIGTVTLAVNNNGGAATAPVSGSPYTITPSAAMGGTFSAGNYSITYATGNLTVNGAALTIAASAQSKTYGQTVSFGVGSALFSSSGLQNGETIGTVTLAVNNNGGAATAPVSGSPYTITPSAATGGTFSAGNYSITYATGNLTVNGAALTIAASAQSKTYGQTVSFGGGSTLFSSSGLQNGETIGSVTLAVNNNGGAATAPVSGSPYTITPSAATGGTFSAGNYSITYATGNLTVNGAALTIAASAQSKTYGQTVSFGSGSTLFSSSGLQNGETIGSVTLAVNNNGGAATAPVSGSPYTITPSAATGGTFSAGNYSITYATGNLTVNGAALTIAASAQSKTYGQTVSFGSGSTLFSSSGLQNGETIGSVTLAVNNNGGAATAPVSGSPYTITPSAATGGTFSAGNYSIAYATGNLTVNGAALTIAASAQSKTYGQSVVFGSGSTLFSSSGLQNGETIGTVTLTVNNNGGAATAPVSGSPYTITPSAATGGTFTPGNYVINYIYGLLTVSQATPLLTWTNPAPIIYGEALSSIQLDATANVSGSSAYTPANSTVLTVGTNTLSMIFSPTDTIDYTSASDEVSMVITPALLTASASNASQLYGAPNPMFTGTLTGLTNDDNITATYSTTATNNSPAGMYPIVPALVDPDDRQTNYTVSLVDGTLTINTPPTVQAAIQAGNSFTFTWNTTATSGYQIQYTTNLSQGAWANWGGPIAATNSTATASVSISNSQTFYRVVLLP